MDFKLLFEKIKSRPILIFLVVLIIASGTLLCFFILQESFRSFEPPPPNKNPEIEQKDYILSSKDPEEKHKTTLYGKIVKVEGNILTLKNKGTVKVEIAENARFYRLNPKIGLEPISKEELRPNETVLAGDLSPSDLADYKAEIFTLSEEPTLLWRVP